MLVVNIHDHGLCSKTCLTDIVFLIIKYFKYLKYFITQQQIYIYTKTRMSRRPHKQPSKGSYSAPDTVSSRTDSRHDWDFSQSKIMLSGHFIPTTSTIESTAMIFNCRISPYIQKAKNFADSDDHVDSSECVWLSLWL